LATAVATSSARFKTSAFVTLLTGRGGWPMSSFLTPEGKTFLGDSYFPPEPFKKLLLRVNEVWQQQNALVLKRADEVASYTPPCAIADKLASTVASACLSSKR
jgi:uncharacterized protein YyaL (SSP411 family)